MKTTKARKTNPVSLTARNIAGVALTTAAVYAVCGNLIGAALVLGCVALPAAAFWLASR